MKHIQKLLPFFCFPSLLLTSCFSKAPQPDSSTSESEQASSELDSSGHEHSSSEGGHPTSGEPSSFENSSSMGPSSENSSLPSFGEARFEGTESLSWPLNHYFDPFDGVKAYDGNGEEVTSSLVVDGHVDFSKEGLYRLTYRYGDSFAEREVRISKNGSASLSSTQNSRDVLPSFGKASLRQGEASDIPHPNFAPSYCSSALKGKPIPTNKWWSCLVSQNRGGLSGAHSNSLYPGAYKASFQAGGFEFTDNGKGFVEYGKAGPAQNENTASVHGNFFVDSLWKTPSLSSDYQTSVISYSDACIKVACRNGGEGSEDEMIATMTEGSPFAYLEIKGNELSGSFRSAGITKPYRFFDLDGNPVSGGEAYSGDALIFSLQGSHVGYESSLWGGIGAPIYQDLYFLLVGGEGSTFYPVHKSHADATMVDGIDITLGKNILALSPLGREGSSLQEILTEAKTLRKHAFSKVSSLNSSYAVDHSSGEVKTRFSAQVERMESQIAPILGLFPHQAKNSSTPLLPYYHEGFQGKLRYASSSSFETTLRFEGLLPSLPLSESLDRAKLTEMLRVLDGDNIPGIRHYDNSKNSYLNKSAPYWNAKSLYPLSMGLTYAKQLGEESLSASFQSKLKEVLSDWLTYDPSVPSRNEATDQAGDRYFYYDSSYGALNFSDGEFNTSSELSDHHFTHGYLIYAASMLSIYEPEFLEDYGDLLDFEVRDIASYDRDDPYFPYLRCFDPYMGHCWANGLGDFGDGNNEESEGEALSAWAACYLYGQIKGDEGLVDASIYGYVSELESAKTYWFDYGKDVWLPKIHESGVGVMAIQWGGKYDYATWFGANPSFIYGIEWLPIGAYLSGYAQNETERKRLEEIYALYEKAQRESPLEKTWRANFASVCSLFDPEKALEEFDEEAMRKEDYPNEIPLSYAFVTSNASLGFRESGISVLDPRISYSKFSGGAYFFNPTDKAIQTKAFVAGRPIEISIEPRSYRKA